MLQPLVSTDKHDTAQHDNVTDVESVAVFNEEKEEVTVFAVNRNIEEDVEFTIDIRGMEGYRLLEHIVMESEDRKSCNSLKEEKVYPKMVKRSELENGIVRSYLTKASWNVIRLGKIKPGI